MALNIRINLENCYEFNNVSSDLTLSQFVSDLKNGNSAKIGVMIDNERHQFLPDVFNLSFGPINDIGQIDDTARLSHENYSKVFSTIVLASIIFLTKNSNRYIGIDGSSNARAYLYFRTIQNNHDTLTTYFDIYGVNYYVRILRKDEKDNMHRINSNDITTIPRAINKGEKINLSELYNYFIFKLKK